MTSALTPVIHMNGNSKENLLREWINFDLALGDLPFPYETFHDRNHYVKTNEELEAYKAAKLEFWNHIKALRIICGDVIKDINETN